MLIKQFLNEQEFNTLKNWNGYLKSKKIVAGGKYCNFWCFNNDDNFIKNISNKFLNIIGMKSQLDPFLNNLITEIKPNGYASIHTDANVDKHKHIRCNILINKAENGGHLIHNNNKIIMNENDCYIIDASIEHGITTVTGNKTYKLISFGFSVKE